MDDTTSTVTRFRKKPLVIEAIRFDGTNRDAVEGFAPGYFQAINPADREGDPDIVAEVYDRLHSTWVGVRIGNWIARGVRGEYYPIDAGVMADTYEDANTAEMFTWGKSVSTTNSGSTVGISGHRGKNWAGDIRLSLTEAALLRDMLDDLVCEAQQKAEVTAGRAAGHA